MESIQSDDIAQDPGLGWALAGQVVGCSRGLLFLAHILPFFVPAFESDCGLLVPWSLIVQGEELLKAFPRVWRVHPCPFQTLELSDMSSLRFVLLHGTWCCVLKGPFAGQGPASRSLWLRAGHSPPRAPLLEACSASLSHSPLRTSSAPPLSTDLTWKLLMCLSCPVLCLLEGGPSVLFCVVLSFA